MSPLRALSALPCLLALAAAPAEPSWTVFGFELGKPVTLPICPRKILLNGRPSAYVYESNPPETCHEPDIALLDAPWRRGFVNFPLTRMPVILHSNGAYTFVVDGKLEGLNFDTLDHTHTAAILDELTAKFGPPTSVARTVGGPAGIGLPAVHAEWRLPGIYVSYRNIDSSVEYGTLEIDTPAMQARRKAHVEAKARARTAL